MSSKSQQDIYLQATPAGAYYCTRQESTDTASRLLRYLLGAASTPLYSLTDVSSWLDCSETKVQEVLRHMEKIRWLQNLTEPRYVTPGAFEEVLPGILAPLSQSEKILLADGQGFYIASQGIPHETAEELSALGADLSSLYERHQGLLKGNLNFHGNWAVVDAAGYSQLGFWPLHVGKELFFLIVEGMPRFDHKYFLELVWLLYNRYAPSVSLQSPNTVSKFTNVRI